ncbi:cytochrome P450 [Nocardia takedensis]
MNTPPVLSDTVAHDLPRFLTQAHLNNRGRPFALPGGSRADSPTAFCIGPGAVGELFAHERDSLAVHNTEAVHGLFRRAVFTLSGDEHTRARAHLAVGLRHDAITAYLPAVAALAHDHVTAWRDRAPVALHQAVRSFTMQVCLTAILGLRPDQPTAQQIPELFDRFVAGTELPADASDSGPTRIDALTAAEDLRTILHACALRGAPAAAPSVVSTLAAAGPAPAGELVDHLLALLIAARETTASLITWMLIECALDPRLGVTGREDARGLLADPARAARRGAAAGLRAAMAECLRRHTPNTASTRIATADIAVADCVIPAGWRVAYSAPATGLLPQLYENPDHFDPGRFTGPQGVSRAGALLGFGRGAHSCAGRGFAEAVTLLAAAAVLADHRIELLDPRRPAVARFHPVRVPAGSVDAVLHRQDTP